MAQAYSLNFDPALLPGETATLKGADFPEEGQPVVCRAVGALPEYTKDFGALTAGTWKSDQEDTNLEMPTLELAQLRMRVLEDFKLRLKHPSATSQWRTRAGAFELHTYPADDLTLREFLFRASEFFIWEETTPRFDLYSASAQTVSYIWFGGWKFKVDKITKAQLTSPMVIWVGSWPSGK